MPRRPLLLVSLLLAFPAAAGAAAKRPDLVVAKASLGTGTASVTVRNAGHRAAPATTARFTVLLASGGQTLADVRIKKLGAGKAATVVAGFAAPAEPGTHAVSVCADALKQVRETREGNDCRAAGQLIVATPPTPTPGPTETPAATTTPTATPTAIPGNAPDLVATDVSDPPSEVPEGGQFSLHDTVADTGFPAGASTTRFYLSPDGPKSLQERRTTGVSLTDVVMGGYRDVPALAPGAGSSDTTPTLVTVPVGTRAGTYYVLACADDREAVAESDEGDNCVFATHPENGVEKPSLVKVIPEQTPDGATQEYRMDTESQTFDPMVPIDPSACGTTVSGSFATVDGAIASAQAFLDQKAPDAMAAFKASPEYDDTLALQQSAQAAIVAGAPAAALAALLRAHELEPTESSHLINAAPIATGLGMPAQALAFLDGARRLDDPDHPAMGLRREAVALANRGEALAHLGRYTEAETALKAALDQEPLLSEAQASLAMVELCGKQNVLAALDRVKLAAVRVGPKEPDDSLGRASVLRHVDFPALPAQAAADADFWVAFGQQLNAESSAQASAQSAKQGQIDAAYPAWSPAQRDRYLSLLKRIGAAKSLPDIKAKRATLDAALMSAQQDSVDFWVVKYTQFLQESDQICTGSNDPNCFDDQMTARCKPATNMAHQAWLDHMDAGYAAAKDYYAALSRRISGLAANFADPNAYGLAMLMIQREEINAMIEVVDPAKAWTQYAKIHQRDCIDPVEDTPPAPPVATAPDGPGGCPDLLKPITAIFEAGPAKVKITCEQIKVEISSSVTPWIKAFAEVAYKFKGEQFTLVTGAKAELQAGVSKGSFKSGLYTVVDSHGIRDVGWRVGPSFDVSNGAVQFTAKDEIDISIVGAALPGL